MCLAQIIRVTSCNFQIFMTLTNPRAFDVTHRSVFMIAVPMTFAYLSTPLVGLADTAVIGQLGDAALIGGIAVGSILFDILFTSCNFLRSGTTGLVAQAIGAHDRKTLGATLVRALLTGIAIGFLFIVLQPLLLVFARWFFQGSQDVQSAMSDYFTIRVLSSPFALMNYAILGYAIGLGRSGTGLLLQTFLNGINIALTAFFVLSLQWGVEGAALGTVLAEILTALCGLAWVATTLPRSAWPKRRDIFETKGLKRLFGLNRDIMIRSFALIFAIAFFTRASSLQGETVLAANAVLQKFFLIAGYFLDGMATAAEQLVGRAIGARHRPAYNRSLRLTAFWSFLLAGLCSLVFWLAGPSIIALITTAEDVRSVAGDYMLYAALTPLVGMLAFQMDGVFIGATWSRDMRNMMLASVVIFLSLYYLLEPILGNDGLWIAFLVFIGARGLTLAWVSRRRAAEVFEPVS
jgi:MATE family multidrug resistance protein